MGQTASAGAVALLLLGACTADVSAPSGNTGSSSSTAGSSAGASASSTSSTGKSSSTASSSSVGATSSSSSASASSSSSGTAASSGASSSSSSSSTGASSSSSTASSSSASSSSGSSGSTGGFVHPGVLLGSAELDFVKNQLTAGAQPWTSAMSHATGSHFASLTYTAHPAATLSRSTSVATDIASDDIAAYTDALIYAYTGNAQYADKSIAIMNSWSSTLTSVDSTAQLDAAWASEVFPRAAEIIRSTYSPAAGHTPLDVPAFSAMLTQVLLPQLDPTSNGAIYSNGNWELSMADGTMNIGVFTDDRAVFDQGVAMWRARVPAYIYESSDGAGPVAPPGGVYNTAAKVKCLWVTGGQLTSTCAVPSGFAFVSGLAQETCRDMSHVILAFEAMVYGAETARLQGVDLYGSEMQRLIDGFEFAAKYDVEALDNLASSGTSGSVQDGVCGGSLNLGGAGYTLGWELAYTEYVDRRGQSMPHTSQMISRVRPTAAALHMDWETLTLSGTP